MSYRDVEWPVPHMVSDELARQYPDRVLIEHSCGNCGCGFSSVKPTPRFCSYDCRTEWLKQTLGKRSSLLWEDASFVTKIQTERAAAGYPEVDEKLNTAKRKARAACKNALRRCLLRSGKLKDGRTYQLLGYSSEQLRKHIEELFIPGMTWENYGEWEIDHIRPVVSFPIETPVSVINALTNLQPLWRHTNRKKWSHYGGI